jgi:hypothetical protein
LSREERVGKNAMLKSLVNLAAAAAFMVAAAPARAPNQIDPDQADAGQQTWEQPAEAQAPTEEWTPIDQPAAPADAPRAGASGQSATTLTTQGAAVPREDVFDAAEGVFGRGAQGLAGILENILRDQGEPIAYIAGQEASGAFVLGLRYGSGVMRHQIEGDRTVYWTGPSIGFDFGADANKVFVLVYNLHDSQQLFRRYPGAEGNAYFVGGFTAQYLRRGDVVLIPIRLGVGLRLGVNAGYMRFSERNRWLPF